MAFPTGAKRFLTRLSRMGVSAAMDPRRAKRIIISNQISLSIALLSLPYVLIYLFSDAGLMGWLEIPIFLGYASVHRFNKAGFTRFSRLWLISLANLDILVYTLSMGKAIGLHLFYLIAGCAPLILFEWEERKSLAYGIGLSFLLFLGTEAFAPHVGLIDPIAPASVQTLRLIEVLTLELVQVLMIIYFLRGNRATEMSLIRASGEAKAADRAKSLFLERMSGEIRVPLDDILGKSHLLLKSGLGAERRETLDDIQLSAQDLLTLVDELLDLSRIETGGMRLEKASFSPIRLGHSVLRPFEFEAGRKGLALNLEADPDLPGHLQGDAARIKQVLRNLIGNAFKFTERGGIILRIRTGSRPIGGDPALHYLVFEIEDSGIGVPEAARSAIFEPFSQGDASTTRKYGGTGLGLFISKQIVELMGGAIGLRPREGGGAVFHFSLPLPGVVEPVAKPLQAALANASDAPLPSSARALRLLVVDDHALNRKVLASFLRSYGCDADLAESGEQALQACEATAYHVIFMDCHMPLMDGYECARRLRAAPRKGPRPTIIGVTADAMENTLRKCLDAGMDALLIKPLMEKQLRALLAECAVRAA